MEAEKRREQDFFDLAERFRRATDPLMSNGWAIKWVGSFSADNATDRDVGQAASARSRTSD